MRKRLPVVLTSLLVFVAALHSQSSVSAQDPAPAREALPDEHPSLLLAIDALRGTLSEPRTLIAEMRARLERERAQVGVTEGQLQKAEARRLEIEGRMKALMARHEAEARQAPGRGANTDPQIAKFRAYERELSGKIEERKKALGGLAVATKVDAIKVSLVQDELATLMGMRESVAKRIEQLQFDKKNLQR